MGAWGAGSFDNDDAWDWTCAFLDEPSRRLIEMTLEAVTHASGEELEAPESSKAIAAAEVVAALKQAPHAQIPEEILAVLSSGQITIDQNLVDLALTAIASVRTNSELKDLWEESDPSEWFAAISELEERIRQ
jgi:Domain of unknown function (DUF4259)